jgi:Ca-activated chloride channel homolog
MQFVNPTLLSLLILIPLSALFLWHRENRRITRLHRLGDPALVAVLSRRVSYPRRIWKSALWVAALAALIIALARPTWGTRTDIIEAQGASVFILLDVSQSMNAQDITPSRLDRAKIDVRELTAGIAGNEVGLVAFAGSAFVAFPLTTDTNAPQVFLNTLTTDIITRQGTAIGTAINLALNAFEEAQATHNVIVLITDGEDHQDDLNGALAAARATNIPIHVLAYGTEAGGSIPIRNSAGQVIGNKEDRLGNIVITRLNAPLLRQIATETDGLYQRITEAPTPVQTLIDRINALDGAPLNEEDRIRGVERFALFATLSLILLSLEILTPEGRPS